MRHVHTPKKNETTKNLLIITKHNNKDHFMKTISQDSHDSTESHLEIDVA